MKCKGQGVRIMVRQLGPGYLQQMQVKCEDCDGQGETCDPKLVCKACTGDKVVKTKRTLEVHVEKGMSKNAKITFKNESDQLPGQLPGDVVVMLEEEEHKVFTREGAHLIIKKTISLKEALTGVSFEVTHLDGRVLQVKTEEGSVVSPKSFFCIRDEGMPTQNNPFVRGNLYVEFEVEFPVVDDQLKTQLKKILPNTATPDRKKAVFSKDGRNAENVTLENVDMQIEKMRWQEERQQEKSQYDEDDDDTHGGGGAQCRAQ